MTFNRAANTDLKVLEFYKTLPFNQHSSVAGQIKAIKKNNPVLTYPVLPPLLTRRTSVLEVGCGTGWLSNTISHYYQSKVSGIDFNPKAIEFCQEVAHAMQLTTEFNVADLFTYQPKSQADLVVSLGVLHHTHDCLGAIKKICADFVAPGGYVLIGLYHRYGRKPFLEHFKAMQAAGASQDKLLVRYQALHSAITDPTHLRSWFRDQVQHPHETQHTLQDILPLLQDAGFTLITTSINSFEPISSENTIKAICAKELDMEQIGRDRLAQNQYYPGFFLFLAQKNPA
jgi:2-polyprenyl-3-methyl-5-hydroxy-6-metoxy-1,4-benzoquinol methylase